MVEMAVDSFQVARYDELLDVPDQWCLLYRG